MARKVEEFGTETISEADLADFELAAARPVGESKPEGQEGASEPVPVKEDGESEMSFRERLICVQSELIAKKGRVNTFSHFNYRSAEDILEAVKPLLKKYGLMMSITDSIVPIDGRYYVRSKVTVFDTKSDEKVITKGFAREADQKKGSDEAQITGAASSYARKYALCGMFLIDDSDDPDRYDNSENEQATPAPAQQPPAPGQKKKGIACVNCGHLIQPYKSKEGAMWTPEQFALSSGGLCLNCYNAARRGQ